MKPEDRIVAYLFAHKAAFQYSTMDIVVKDVKLSVFYGMSQMSDEGIRKVVAQWAVVNAVGLLVTVPTGGSGAPAPPGTLPTTDSEFIDAVKKAVSTINDGVTVGKKGANVNIGVTGLTGNLKSRDNIASLRALLDGETWSFGAESGPFHFQGELSSDKSRRSHSSSPPDYLYPPDLSTLGKVFSEGEKAVRQDGRDATRRLNNISDARKVGALVKPARGRVAGGR